MKQLHEYETPETNKESLWVMDLTGATQVVEIEKSQSLEQRLAACRDALEEIQRINEEFNCDEYISEQCREALALTAPK